MTRVILGPRTLKEAARFVDWLVLEGLDRDKAARAVKQFAEAIAGKKPPVDPSLAIVGPNPCLQQYRALYRQKFGEDPEVGSKDYALLSRLIRNHGAEAVTKRLNALAATRDAYLRQFGFTIVALSTHWNKLAAIIATERRQTAPDAPTDCRHTPRCQTAIECNLTNLRSARA